MPAPSFRLFNACVAITLVALTPSLASAEDNVAVHDAWARATPGAATTGAAYVALTGADQADSLVSASTPIAATAEAHETTEANGVMKMRPVKNLPIPAHQTVTLKPGGYHIMLMGLKQPLVAGQSFPLTLTFTHTPPVTVKVDVRATGRNSNSMGGSMGGKM
jgi:periplasmic copper chaperone A